MKNNRMKNERMKNTGEPPASHASILDSAILDSAILHSAILPLSRKLHRLSTGWVALAAVVVFALFMVFVLPQQALDAAASSGNAGSPDTSLWYTPAELYRMAEVYGAAGRRAYIRARFTFDLVWPLVYGAFLATAISWLNRAAFPAESLGRLANLVPALGVVLDFLENISTSLVMARYPRRTPGVDLLAPVFTLTKWLFVGGSFVLLVAVAAAALWRRVRRSR